jgi:hypothetical protein
VRFEVRRVKGLERVQDPFFKYAEDFFLGGDICRKNGRFIHICIDYFYSFDIFSLK